MGRSNAPTSRGRNEPSCRRTVSVVIVKQHTRQKHFNPIQMIPCMCLVVKIQIWMVYSLVGSRESYFCCCGVSCPYEGVLRQRSKKKVRAWSLWLVGAPKVSTSNVKALVSMLEPLLVKERQYLSSYFLYEMRWEEDMGMICSEGFTGFVGFSWSRAAKWVIHLSK